MKLIKKFYSWRRLGISLVAAGIFVSLGLRMLEQDVKEERFPADVVGVHHLGADHVVNNFYINKSISDNVGEGGGGGSRRCCVNLPRQPSSNLSADVRWEVSRIIRHADPTAPETVELEGIYQAQVPVESYVEPGDFYVHFFSNGRVRIVVSRYTSSGELHPIQADDALAENVATPGRPIKAIFSKGELDELERKIYNDRKLHGDWR
ncbi:hypothetical protein ABIB38_001690 [Massilia sp. UYP11]|uniref:DUF3304 domain-containing protein n=1 Tax=Massilia sp. UYP11 TaxID=1756385 RepID=UPI003D1BAE4E